MRNEVKFDYNDFGQPVKEYQEHEGEVDGSTLHVDYTYASPDGLGTPNTIRPTAIMYPNTGSVRLTVATGYASGESFEIDGAFNLPTGLTDIENGHILAQYRYMGTSTPVEVNYSHADAIRFTLGTAAENYPGMDRFGRLVETIWQSQNGETKLVHTQYGRNRFGGVVWRYDAKAHAMSKTTEDNFYRYDGLYRVGEHQRGELNTYHTGIDPAEQTEVFQLDQMGNWLAYESDQLTPAQTREFNPLNEITELTNPSGVIQPVYDLVGNMTTIPSPDNWTVAFDLTWDAWNRLVRVEEDASLKGAYTYDALNRRILSKTLTTDEPPANFYRHFYHDTAGRVLEEWTGTTTLELERDYVWGIRGPADLIRRSYSASPDLFVLSDGMNPVAIYQPETGVVERYSYDTYGPVRILEPEFSERDPNQSAYRWNFLWNSMFRGAETGLYNSHLAWFDTQLGRFLSENSSSGLQDYETRILEVSRLEAGPRCCVKDFKVFNHPISNTGSVDYDPQKANQVIPGQVIPATPTTLGDKMFAWSVRIEFADDWPQGDCACYCWYVRHYLLWDLSKPNHRGWNPDEVPPVSGDGVRDSIYLPNTWYEDRAPNNARYGHRERDDSGDSYFDENGKSNQRKGCYYKEDDQGSSAHAKGHWTYSISVRDSCQQDQVVAATKFRITVSGDDSL